MAPVVSSTGLQIDLYGLKWQANQDELGRRLIRAPKKIRLLTYSSRPKADMCANMSYELFRYGRRPAPCADP
jgi:hypothetical protein